MKNSKKVFTLYGVNTNPFFMFYFKISLEGVSPENRLLALYYGFNPNKTTEYEFLWKLYETSPMDTDRRILMRTLGLFKSKFNE